MRFWQILLIVAFSLFLRLPVPPAIAQTSADIPSGQLGTPKPLDPNIVGAGGEFTERVEIALPEFRGLPLPVALRYNSSDSSRSGPGKIVAIGWSLSGTSMIERKSLGGGVPTYDDGQDVYVLDGQELMACQGNGSTNPWTGYYPLRFITDRASASCIAGGNLTSRVEDYRRIVFNQGANTFTVTRPDGLRLIYTSIGVLADVPGATVNYGPKARYLLTRIEDTQSAPNSVTYTYAFASKDDGYAHRIERIDYAGYSVRFGYGTFPSNAVAKFATGTSLMGKQAYQLRSIRVMDGETPIRGYKLTYGVSALTQTQLLTKIEEFGADLVYAAPEITGGTALPGKEFGYSADTVSFEMKTYPGKEFHEAVTVSDTDYDGTDELILTPEKLNRKADNDNETISSYYTFMAGHYSLDRQRNISNEPAIQRGCWPYSGPNSVTLSYVNGVRRWRDLPPVSASDRGTSPIVCLKNNFRHYETGTSDNSTTEYKLVSLNMLTATATATLQSGGISGFISSTPATFGNFDLDAETEVILSGAIRDIVDGVFSTPSSPGKSWSGPGSTSSGRYSADFSGDGVDDVVKTTFYRVTPELGYLAGVLTGRAGFVNFSIPTGNAPPTLPHSSYLSGGAVLDFLGYGDLDGNGLSDIIFQNSNNSGSDTIVAYLSNGTSLSSPITFTLPNLLSNNRSYTSFTSSYPRTVDHRSAVTDINSDGLVDLIIHDGFPPLTSSSDSGAPYTSGKTWVFVNTGSGFSQIPVSGSLAGFNRLVATGDFDGDGLVDIALEGATNTSSGLYGYVRQDGRILFGNGGIPNRLTSIKSQTGAVTTVAYAPSSDFGTNQMPGVQQVVKSITTDDGRGGISMVEYRYVGGRYDFIARQTLGYKTVTAYLPALPGESEGPQVVTTYLNDHLAEYGLVKSRVVAQGGVTLSREIFDYTIEKTGNGPSRADRTSERTARLYGTALVETMLTRAYDSFGQVVRETNLGFTSDGMNLDPSDDVTVSMGYAPNLAAYIVDRPNFRREEAGTATTATLADDLSYAAMSYDGASANTTAPTSGNLTKVEEWTGNPSTLTLRTAKLLTYDAWGNVLTETDAKAAAAGTGPTVSYTYDTAKRLFRVTTTNAPGQVETVAWNTICQAPASVTDANLRVTTKTYDAFCRETRTDLPGGQYLATRYVAFGNPAAQYVERETKSGSATAGRDLLISREYFDGLARVWAKVQPGTTSAIADSVLQLSAYDVRGNLAWTSLPLAFANLNSAPNAAQRTGFTYDGLDRPIDTLLADGAKRSLAYLTVSLSLYGGPTLAYPATRSQDEHCFDATAANTLCGEAIQVTDAAGRLIRSDRNDAALTDMDAGGQTLRSTSYRYDRKGSLIGVTDPGGITFAYTYDVYGNRLTADDPGLGFWTLTYDANNNLLTQTDAKGQLISFAYDALNRVTLKTVGTGASRVETRFTYDQARAGFYNLGKETTQEVWTPAGTTHKVERDWHLMGGLAVERHTIDGRTYALETNFAPNGAPLDQKLPGTPGATTTGWVGPFTYDAAGRVSGFTGYVTSIAYNSWGQPSAASYVNGVAETYAYDPARGWLTSVTGTLPGGDMAFRAAYTRSATGRIARADTQALVGGNPTDLGGSYDYAYDYTGRLVSATNWRGITAFDQAFAYDRAGRIRAKGPTLATATTYAYTDPLKPDHAPSAVTTAGVITTFTYDANGNMLTGLGGKIMTYDGENRPLSVTFNGKRTCYVYGADGKRLKKVEGLPPTQDCTALPANANTTVYFGPVEIRNWKVVGLEQVLTYPHPAVKLLNGTTPAAATYLHRDGLASVRAITNAAGAKIEAALYKPFGEQSEWVLPGNAAPETKGWIGERYDADAGLQYLNARYYDPELSLFLQPDWFEVTERGVGTNRFSYSFSDPVNLSDPNGNVVPLVVGGICALGGCEAVASFFVAGAVVVTAEVASDAMNDGTVNGNGAAATTGKIIAGAVKSTIGDNGGPDLDVPSGSDLVDGLLQGLGGRTSAGKQNPRSVPQYEAEGADIPSVLEELEKSGISLEPKGSGVHVGKLPSGERIIVRENSKEGRPTIEIQGSDGRKTEETRLGKKADDKEDKDKDKDKEESDDDKSN